MGRIKDIMRIVRFTAKMIRYLWAGPYTLLGLLLVPAALLGGATVRPSGGTLEVAGGRFGAWITRLPPCFRFCAITIGHVILGADPASLIAHRRHERIHVRQYERWGVLFIPLYCASSLLQFFRGRDPYLENRFEREACSCGSCPGKVYESPVPGTGKRLRCFHFNHVRPRIPG
ncbi:MAG TPA: hypothetical protein PK425_03890 [Syntrophales bacterium]|jgi:hypothetical protein|nr:hypothetical protein [Syntrophales bacterium]